MRTHILLVTVRLPVRRLRNVWRHTRRGDKYVTVIIDLTAVRAKDRPRSCSTWSKAVQQASRPGCPKGRKPGATPSRSSRWRVHRVQDRHHRELPDAVTVMDPSTSSGSPAMPSTNAAGIQQTLHGHRGRAGDPLYAARRTLHTGADLPHEKQTARLDALFASTRTSRSKRPGVSTNA